MAANNTWVTVDDLKEGLTEAGPWPLGDVRLMTIVCNAVDAYIKRVRPDLTPPNPKQSASGGTYSAFSIAFDNAFVPPAPGGGGNGDGSWAALQLAMHLWDIRGTNAPTSYEQFGMAPTYLVPRFVEDMLEIGRAFKPVIA